MRTVFAIVALWAASVPALAQGALPLWSDEQLSSLRRWVDDAPLDALPRPSTVRFDESLARGDRAAISAEARALALQLANAHLHGAASAAERAGWRISDDGDSAGVEAALDGALAAGGTLDGFFSALRPVVADYALLRAALVAETDWARRETLGRNMERWRWMPHDLGGSYLLVNAAAFEVRYWRNGRPAGLWPVVVGKVSSPTPVFSARVTGVTLNPWWDLPAGIVAEMRGKLSAARGYVFSGGRWRQRPGPGNSLGRMKLAMQNPWNVYLHDTPSKSLFAKPVRAFSHGCVRVGDALGFAATLLDGVKTRGEVDAIVAAGRTVTVDLPATLPVYIAYFTAAAGPDGKLAFHPDIYRRDTRIAVPPVPNDRCGV